MGLNKIAFLTLIALAGGSVENPRKCSLSDTNLNTCMVESFQDIIPILVKGIPKFKVFPIDPLRIDLLDLSDAPGKVINVRHKFMNVKMYGMGSAQIRKVRLDPKNVELELHAVLKEPFVMTGNYLSRGKILSLPIHGEGNFNITLVNMRCTLKMKGHEIIKKNNKHIQVDSVKFQYQIDRLILNFENLFKGNKQISDTLNNVLNENWEAVLDDMRESFEQAIGTAFKEISNGVLSRLPLSDLVTN